MTGALVQNFRMLARYNALANRRLYEACARLSDVERKKRRLAFFGSIHGTLNHLMAGNCKSAGLVDVEGRASEGSFLIHSSCWY